MMPEARKSSHFRCRNAHHSYPDIPTLIELGVDVEADTWMGLIAPGGMPKALVETISKDVAKVINSEKVREAFAAQYMEPVGSSPEQFRTVISAEITRWAPIIKAANVPKVN